jgi:hypothetical protein
MELTPSWDSLRNEQVNLIKTVPVVRDSDQIEDLNILLKGLLRV